MSNIREETKRLREIWGGFRSARVLITANNYRVFDLLKTPQNVNALSQKLNINSRAAERLLDALTGLGLLRKSGHEYKNLPISNRFLVKDSSYYQAMIRLKNRMFGIRILKLFRPSSTPHQEGLSYEGSN